MVSEPLNAGWWLARVQDAGDTLEQSPRRCPLALEDTSFTFELRVLNIDGFILLFTVDDTSRVARW